MKKILTKVVLALIIVFGINVLFNSFATPLDNNVALLQLEDSNSSLAVHNAYQAYGAYIRYGLSLLVVALFFFKDIKKLIGGNANENK